MDKLVVLNLGEGDFKQGFPVTLQVWEEGGFLTSFVGKLPASAIDFLYDKWQSDYRQKVSGRMIPTPGRVSNYSDTDLTGNSNILKAELNNWLNSETFRPVRDKFLTTVKSKHTVRVIIQTENPRLRRLPWYLWDLFVKNYPLAEMALSSPTFERVEKSVQPKPKVRILAILGDSSPPDPKTGIRLDINADKQFLENLPDAETVFLVEPKRHEFNEQLWDERGWDILFFAGHSTSESDGTTGKIYINCKEYLTIDDLKYALKEAICRGLQLAIFNSCDGLGIAKDLAELQIPQIIAMREPVADFVAKEFLKYFLTSFSKGQDLYLAVRKAREKLHGLEKDFPCASWLPLICQNPAENPVTWQGLRGIETGINWREVCQEALAQRQRLTTNPLTTGDGINFAFDDIYVPLGLVERVKKEKRPGEVSPEEGSHFYQPEREYEVTRTYNNDEFFAQVLKQGKTPKSQGRRLAVMGEPGAGKTTLLQKIAHWVASETEQDVAIWVSLADLQGRSVEEYLLQKWLKDALGVVRVTPEMEEALALLFKSGRVWLLLDGVDEMAAGGNPLGTVAAQISGWVAQGRVVLTCRQNVWDAGKNALEGFDVYRNLDFDYPDGVAQFIHRWFALHPELGKRLLAELAQAGKERIRDTVKNPLRLALLCRAWQIRQGGLPETKAGLYGQFAEALYEWKQEAFPTTSQQQRELNAGLGRLALRGMEQSESRFRLREGLVREVLGETDEPLCRLALQLGWLNLVGVAVENPSERVYAFYHPTFQEYFAALVVDDWGYFLHHVPDNPRLGTYRIFEKQWKEVILLWFGRGDVGKQKKEEFVRELLEFEDGCKDPEEFVEELTEYLYGLRGWIEYFYWYHTFLLATSVITEFKECSLTDEILLKLIKMMLDKGGIDEKNNEFSLCYRPIQVTTNASLQQTFKERLIEKLIDIMEDIDIQIENLAIQQDSMDLAIGAIVSVTNILLELEPINEEAIAALLKVISSVNNEPQELNKPPEFLRKAIKVLGKVAPGNYLVIECLLSLIKNLLQFYTIASSQKGNSNILFHIWDIVDSFGNIAPGNSSVISVLIEIMKTANENEDTLLEQVATSLIKIAYKDKFAISELSKIIEDTESEFTYGERTYILAVYTLAKIDEPKLKYIEALITTLKTTDYLHIGRLSADKLSEVVFGIPEGIAKLRRIMENGDEYIRCQAAYILAKIDSQDKSAISVLIQMLKKANYKNTQFQAVWALNKTTSNNPFVITAIIELLKNIESGNICIEEDWDIDIFTQAMWILEKMTPGNDRAISALIGLIKKGIKDNNENFYILEMLKLSIYTLGKIASKNLEAKALLIQVLEHFNEQFIVKSEAFDYSWDIPFWTALSLWTIEPNNKIAITEIINFFEEDNNHERHEYFLYFWRNLKHNEQYDSLVSHFKNRLTKKTRDKDPDLYYYYYTLIWQCAQNLTYPEFYMAWHHQLTGTHPEAPDNIPVGKTTLT